MNDYNLFTFSISKYQLIKLDEILGEDQIALRLDKNGSDLGRTIQMCTNLLVLTNNIHDKLSLTANGQQVDIADDYSKINIINPLLRDNILKHDQSFPSNQCLPHFDNLIKILTDIEQFISQLGSYSASSITKQLDGLGGSLSSVIELYSTIIQTAKKCESELLQKISTIPQNEHQFSYQIAAALTAFDELLIQLHFLSVNSIVQQFSDFQNLNKWIKNGSNLWQKLFDAPRSEENQILMVVIEISSELSILSNIISKILPNISESVDFVNSSVSLTNLSQILNEIESHLTRKNINQIIDNLPTSFLSDQPLDSLVTIAEDYLNKFPKTENSSFSTLSKTINKSDNDKETTAICLASIARFAARNFNDAYLGEEILVSLSKKIATITKSIFDESLEIISQINSAIDANLEFINDIALNETNYFLTTAKNIEELDIESENFVSDQQLFFESFCALPTPLKKLISFCPNEDVKRQLNEILEKTENVGDKLTRWINQFYLTLFSMIHFRAEMIVGALSFPISLLCSLNQQEQIKDIQTCFTSIQKIMCTTPQDITGDIKDVIDLIDQIIELSKFGNDFIEMAKSNANSPLFPVYKQSADALSEIIVDLPSYTIPLSQIISIENQDVFICSLLAFITRSLRISKSLKLDDDDAALYQMLSPSFTYTIFADVFINMNSTQNAETLKPLMNHLHTKMNDVYTIVNQIALGENEQSSQFSEEFENFTKAMNDIISSILIFKQPSLQYDIPDDVHEIRKFDSIALSLHSQQLKEIAQYIVNIMKKSNSQDVRTALRKWFDATQVSTADLTNSIKKFKEIISTFLNDLSEKDRSNFIETFSSLSVSLATNDHNYNKIVISNVTELHKKLIVEVHEFLESSTNTELQLIEIYRYISEISSFLPISNLKEKDKDQYLSGILKSVITSLHNLRQKEATQIELNDKLNSIDSVEKLSAFSKVFFTNDEFEVNVLLQKIFELEDNFDIEFFNQSISKFSDKLLQLLPSQFSLLKDIPDKDTVCDYIYDKAEAFRDNVNIILQLAKNHEGDNEKISSSLNVMLLSAADSALLVMHSLMLGDLHLTSLSATFVACFSELQISMREFTDASFMITKNPDENMQPELRRVNRKMVKQFDTFINIVEDPQQVQPQVQQQQVVSESDEFEEKKNELFSSLANFVTNIARLNALSATSLVPEMYTKSLQEIITSIDDSLSNLHSKTTVVLKDAVGPSSSEFSSLDASIQDKIKALTVSSQKVEFNLSFPSYQLLQPCQEVGLLTSKMASLGLLLTDKLVIEPDPEAASRVPADYVIPDPPAMKEPPKPSDAFSALLNVRKGVTEKVQLFNEVNENELATSNELLEALAKLRDASEAFVAQALVMAVATVNPLYQVEQQRALHVFEGALNGVQNALKSRLMRTKLFKSEMADSMSLFSSSIDKSVEYAETASKIEGQPTSTSEEDANEVTRELNATAAVIELMSARLKEFENQVNLDAIQQQDEDIFDPKLAETIEDLQAAIDSLPAYLIAASKPILAAASQLLIRSKQITSDLLKKFSKIENEKGLIKSAQDLSEAAELLLVCAEILVTGEDKSAEFKACTAAKIIKVAVVSLRVEVLKKGGDTEKIISKHTSTVENYSDCIVKRAEAIVRKKLEVEYQKKPKRGSIQIQTINQNTLVENLRKNLANEESNLKKFRALEHKKKSQNNTPVSSPAKTPMGTPSNK